MTSRVEELYVQTRNHPVCGYLIPLESVLGYPIPAIKEEVVFLKFIVYQRGWAPRGDARPIFPPHAQISIEYSSGRLTEYLDLAHNSQSNPIGVFPHSGIASMSVKEVVALQTDLYALTDDIIPLIDRTALTSEEKEMVNKYNELSETLFEPDLFIFYRALNPKFFEWIDENI